MECGGGGGGGVGGIVRFGQRRRRPSQSASWASWRAGYTKALVVPRLGFLSLRDHFSRCRPRAVCPSVQSPKCPHPLYNTLLGLAFESNVDPHGFLLRSEAFAPK